MDEIWKDVIGFEGMYQVSDLGNIKSLSRMTNGPKGHKHHLKEKPLKLFTCNNGHYNFVHFYKDGKHLNRLVHRLVLIAFTGMPPLPDATCNHKNGIGTDNRLENLEWMTQADNNIHSRTILGNKSVGPKPENASKTILTWYEVNRIRELRKQNPKYWLHRRLADKFGVAVPTISHILVFDTWKIP